MWEGTLATVVPFMGGTVGRLSVAVPRLIVVLEPDPSHESAKATKPDGMPDSKLSKNGSELSSSIIVSTAVLGVPRVAALGLESARLTVLEEVKTLSFVIGTAKVLVVWPAAKFKVPEAAV